jgi:hypothetical protein
MTMRWMTSVRRDWVRPEGYEVARSIEIATKLCGVNVAPGLETPSNSCFIELPLMPELERHRDRINFVGLPPSRLVAHTVEFAVVEATERNGELIADPATEGARLSKAQMVRIGRRTTAHEARLACDKLAVLLVAQPDACGLSR